MARKAKVKFTRVQGIGRNTYVQNEIVTDVNFLKGHFDILLKDGKLELIEDKKSVSKVESKKEEKKEVKAEKKKSDK